MEDCPDQTFEMASSIVVGHGRAVCGTGESNTAFHTGGKISARGRGNIHDGDVNTAAHNVDVAVGLECISIGIGTGWGRL